MLIEIHKFIIQFVFFILRTPRHNTDDISRNGNHAEEFHDTDPFVPLFHIKLIHIFVSFDGIPDAFFHMAGAQAGPFCGKFGFLP